MTAFELSVRFFLQAAAVLGACRIVGIVFARLGQSQVVSEMIAGVLLGPSLLGWAAPELSAYLFPPQSRAILYSVSQLGLVLYMFLIGAEFDIGLIGARARSAATISIAGIAGPFALGGLLGMVLAGNADLFPPNETRLEAAIFLGAALSITAFPMLARIILEQGLTKTSLGTLALTAGSINDALAWCALAVALASYQNDPAIALLAVGGGGAFALFAIVVLRRLLAPLAARVERSGGLDQPTLVLVLMIVMLGAWFTDFIRIFAVFGAFLMGIAMPRGRFQAELHRILYPMTTSLLLPFFFVYSGLNTRIGVVNTVELWWIAALVLAAATVGKGVACYLAARWHGEGHRESMAIGTLMNARGLMELIIVNIGLQNHMIEPSLFAMLVMMAVVTTLVATPIFERIYGSAATRRADGAVADE